MSHDEIVERLENWARCVRYGGIRLHRCMSIEGRYSHPAWEDEKIVRADPDLRDGYKIEAILTAPTFPKKFRESIKFGYLYKGYDFFAQCRSIGIRPVKDIYDDTLRLSEAAVGNRIRVLDGKDEVMIVSFKIQTQRGNVV